MNNNTLQNILYNLAQSNILSNPAFNRLLQDYTKYHLVLFIEGGIFALFLLMLSLYFWQQFRKASKPKSSIWTFEKKIYFYFGLITTIVMLFMFLIVAANLSNVLNPKEGFIRSLPDLGTPQVGTEKAKLYEEVSHWLQSGDSQIPVMLENKVKDRLTWQIPKAVICTILLTTFAILSTTIWRSLIKISQTRSHAWNVKEKVFIISGMLTIPAILLLMLMVLGNTQASFAPIMLTLLFS